MIDVRLLVKNIKIVVVHYKKIVKETIKKETKINANFLYLLDFKISTN